MANNVYADFSSTGSLETRYLTGPALDQVFGQVAANGTTTWNLTDSQGSVRQVVNVDGNVLDTIDYDAYGNITSETGTGSRFKYDGMAWDAALGLYLDHAREYDPADGVFIRQDPLSFAAGQSNLGEFVGNGPTDGTDPSGEFAGVAATVLAGAAYWLLTPINAHAPSTDADLQNMAALDQQQNLENAVVTAGIITSAMGGSLILPRATQVYGASLEAYAGVGGVAGASGQLGSDLTSAILEPGTGFGNYLNDPRSAFDNYGNAALAGGVLGVTAKGVGSVGNKVVSGQQAVLNRWRSMVTGPGASLRPSLASTIGERVSIAGFDICDDTLVNFGKVARDAINPTTGPRSYWFRFGDIKHLTPDQLQAVIGQMASAGQPGGANTMRVAGASSSGFTQQPATNMSGIPEYTSDSPVPVGTNVRVND
jgi:RHS repeat-associated protein